MTIENQEQNDQTQVDPGINEINNPDAVITDNDNTDETKLVDSETTKEIKPEDDTDHKGFKKRIDRFNRKLTEKETELNYWKQEALKATSNNQSSASSPASSEANSKPSLAQFNGDVEAYTDALTEYKLNQKELARQQEQLIKEFQAKEEQLRKSDPDYDDIIEDFKDKYKHVNAPEINQFIADSNVGPELFYHLANNHDIIDNLLKMSPLKRIATLGKLEDKLESKSTNSTKVQVPTVSKAPQPVSSEKGKPVVSTRLDDPNLSQAEYRRLRQNKSR